MSLIMNKPTKTGYGKKTADTLIEVIIALFVLVIGSGAATVLIVSSLQANTFSKDSLVGLNLAVEGIEAIRNIRDTNWVKFSYDKENCWNMEPDTASGDPCTSVSGNLIEASNYTVDLNTSNYTWGLTDKGSNLLNLDGGTPANNDPYKLYYIDLDSSLDSDGNGTKTDDKDLHVSLTAAGGTDTGESKFYRMVSVTYDAVDPNIMNVESLVQWEAGPIVHQIKLTSSLTNFNRIKVN